MPKFRVGAENFVRRKILSAENFVAEILSDKESGHANLGFIEKMLRKKQDFTIPTLLLGNVMFMAVD